ncbi:MAG: substrate-binding domain-containing protein, partial [Phycisphaeraceae bacterium JB051]
DGVGASGHKFSSGSHAEGRIVGKQMVRRGYRKIIVVLPTYTEEPVRHYSFSERSRGVASAINGSDVQFKEVILKYHNFEIQPLIKEIKNELGPDVAILASTDRVAMTLLMQMAMQGIRPGIDVGIASCDSTRSTQEHLPELSCVDVKRFDLGIQAADMIVSIIKSPKHTCKSRTIKWSWHEGSTLPAVK